jgi:hypothetical protein
MIIRFAKVVHGSGKLNAPSEPLAVFVGAQSQRQELVVSRCSQYLLGRRVNVP